MKRTKGKVVSIKDHIDAIRKINKRNENFLHVTAYENQMSNTAAQFMSTKISERYYFGGGDNDVVNWDPFTCLGLKGVEDLVTVAELSAAKMLRGSVVNLRCLSGVHAMMCAILVATNPGDSVMVVRHENGGHFSTQPILERSGRKVVYAKYDDQGLAFNADETAVVFRENNCTALYLDISYCTNKVNLRELRAALGDQAIIIYDASHTIGLMMGGVFQSPLTEGADIICANTHKTLPGPHKGMIVFRDKVLGEKLNEVINNGLFSTSHTHHLIALAITILEMERHGHAYAEQIVRNSNALGAALTELGYEVRCLESGEFTETHQIHLYLPSNTPPIDLYRSLVANCISTNFDDRQGGRVFARLGTQELSRRGFKEMDMKFLASLIDGALKGYNVRSQVIAFNKKFNTIHYSFDSE